MVAPATIDTITMTSTHSSNNETSRKVQRGSRCLGESCCSDSKPCRKPRRRPSLDVKAVFIVDEGGDCSSASFDDDVTQVTSNLACDSVVHNDHDTKKANSSIGKSDGTTTTRRDSGKSLLDLMGDGDAEIIYNNNNNNNSNNNNENDDTSVASTKITLTDDRVRSFMVDYYEDFDTIFKTHRDSNSLTKTKCFEAFCDQYYTPDFVFIRPSGNPLSKTQFIAVNSEDIVGIDIRLVSIESIQILNNHGCCAIVVYTADQVFEYKGQPNSDRTVITTVLTMDPVTGESKIAHEHRCPGKPIPKATRWE